MHGPHVNCRAWNGSNPFSDLCVFLTRCLFSRKPLFPCLPTVLDGLRRHVFSLSLLLSYLNFKNRLLAISSVEPDDNCAQVDISGGSSKG